MAPATARPAEPLDREMMREAMGRDLWNREIGGIALLEPVGINGNGAAADNILLLDLSSTEEKLLAGGFASTNGWDWDWNWDYWGDEEAEFDGITVVGPPPTDGDQGDNGWFPWGDEPPDAGDDNQSSPDGGGGDGQGGPGEPDPYRDRITIYESVPPELQERAEMVRDKLAAELRGVGNKIDALPDNAVFRYGNREVTGAEMKEEFAKIGFNITFGVNYGPGGLGANNDGITSANLVFLEGMVANMHPWGNWGPNWLILHELSHLLGVVEQFIDDMWRAYLDSLAPEQRPSRDHWQGTQFFRDGEALTNQFMWMFGQLLGLPTGPRPPVGYDPGQASYDNGSSGGDDGGDGGWGGWGSDQPLD
jgi:hypothetical protein